MTQIYDSTTHQLTALLRNSVPSLIEEAKVTTEPSAMISLAAPKIREIL